MKISVAQTKSFKGEIEKNILHHKEFIEMAYSNGAGMIVFPELSVTGYEPELANELAFVESDNTLDEFQKISDNKKMIICVGMPTKSEQGIMISMIIFQPNKPKQIYSKQYLHDDEKLFFVPGNQQVFLEDGNDKIAFGICYETLVPEHSEFASDNGANIYIASVLNPVKNIKRDIDILTGVARKHKMIVLMSNYAGESGGYVSGGRTAVWNEEGEILKELNDRDEGIIFFDTKSGEVKALKIDDIIVETNS